MNLVLHNKGAGVVVGNKSIFSAPQYKDENNSELLKTFIYIMVNPPLSYKSWMDGITIPDVYSRYSKTVLGVPLEKDGDYAWLLHVLKSLKSNGKAAIILPGIIGLPANLFYGTGIPACILVLDKEDAAERTGIFMIDASKGYVKDGNKNRLREHDIHKIVTTFLAMDESNPKYARIMPDEEVKVTNEYNLNIPRYIDSSEPKDLQDINAHFLPEPELIDFDGDFRINMYRQPSLIQAGTIGTNSDTIGTIIGIKVTSPEERVLTIMKQNARVTQKEL